MPTYVFECLDCNTRHELDASYSVLLGYKAVCPTCRSEKCRRVYLPVGIVFKGNGFYKIDNREEQIEDKTWSI